MSTSENVRRGKFRRGYNAGTGVCYRCGRRTQKGILESQCDLCDLCYEACGNENEHVDNGGHPGRPMPVPNCPQCGTERSEADSLSNSESTTQTMPNATKSRKSSKKNAESQLREMREEGYGAEADGSLTPRSEAVVDELAASQADAADVTTPVPAGWDVVETAPGETDQPSAETGEVLTDAEAKAAAIAGDEALAQDAERGSEPPAVDEALEALAEAPIVVTGVDPEPQAAPAEDVAVRDDKPAPGQVWTGTGMHGLLDEYSHVVILTTEKAFKAACTMMYKPVAQQDAAPADLCPDCGSMRATALDMSGGDLDGAIKLLLARRVQIPSVSDVAAPTDAPAERPKRKAAKPARAPKAPKAPKPTPADKAVSSVKPAPEPTPAAPVTPIVEDAPTPEPQAEPAPAFDALDVIRRLVKGGSFDPAELDTLGAILDAGQLGDVITAPPAEGTERRLCVKCAGHGYVDVKAGERRAAPTGITRKSDRRMSAAIVDGTGARVKGVSTLEPRPVYVRVAFEGGPEERFRLPDQTDYEAIKSVKNAAMKFAADNGASIGQVRAVVKVMTDAGYRVRPRAA